MEMMYFLLFVAWAFSNGRERKESKSFWFVLHHGLVGPAFNGNGGVGVYWFWGGKQTPSSIFMPCHVGVQGTQTSMLRVVHFGWLFLFFLVFIFLVLSSIPGP